mgnify:CR=1 FL=1
MSMRVSMSMRMNRGWSRGMSRVGWRRETIRVDKSRVE